MITVEKNLSEAVRNAVAKHRGGKTRTLVAKPPVETRITFMTSLYADAAELLPTAKTISVGSRQSVIA